MAQRAIVERQRRIHGVLPTGRVIPVICGADPGDPADPTQPDPTQPGGEALPGETGGATDPAAQVNANAGRVYSQQDIDAVTARMRAADQRAAALEQKNKEYENASKSELERAKSEAQEAAQRAEQAERALLDMRIHNAFLTSNKYTWNNPAAALRLIDLSNVTVNPEDGTVTGLDAAIDALAKSDPYLLKPQEGRSSGTKPAASKPSGTSPAANGGTARTDDRQRLMSKYPALRR